MSDGILAETVGQRTVLTCSGDIDIRLADELRQAITRGSRTADPVVVVDVSGARMLDSTALGVLLHGTTACRDAGGRLVVAGSHGPITKALRATGLDHLLELAPDVQRGLAGPVVH